MTRQSNSMKFMALGNRTNVYLPINNKSGVRVVATMKKKSYVLTRQITWINHTYLLEVCSTIYSKTLELRIDIPLRIRV